MYIGKTITASYNKIICQITFYLLYTVFQIHCIIKPCKSDKSFLSVGTWNTGLYYMTSDSLLRSIIINENINNLYLIKAHHKYSNHLVNLFDKGLSEMITHPLQKYNWLTYTCSINTLYQSYKAHISDMKFRLCKLYVYGQ